MRFHRNDLKIITCKRDNSPDTMFHYHQSFWIHSILSFKCFADTAIAACSWSSKDRCVVLRIPFLPMIAGMLRQQSNWGWKWQTGLISRLSKRIEQHRFAAIEAIPNGAEPLPWMMTWDRCLQILSILVRLRVLNIWTSEMGTAPTVAVDHAVTWSSPWTPTTKTPMEEGETWKIGN